LILRKKMREIKFRAWNTESKTMFYDVYFDCLEIGIWNEEGDYELIGDREENRMMPYCILMQYTGLLDIHGKEIWEGDKLKYSIDGHEQTIPYVISDMTEWFEEMYDPDSYYRWDDKGEVIGNIYENPELLENK